MSRPYVELTRLAISTSVFVCVVFIVTFHSSCSESNFASSSPAPQPQNDADLIGDPNSFNSDPGIISTPDTSWDTIENLDIASQEGRSVVACFSYDHARMIRENLGAHYCDRAVFRVKMSGNEVGNINLNNRSGNPISGINPFFGGGIQSADLASQLSRRGGEFSGRWVDGKLDVNITCDLPRGCHNDVTFLSIIGEVVMPSGQTKWLQIDQGQILPQQQYQYNFKDFTLSDVRPSFGSFCELQ